MEFEWDPVKELENVRKHGINFTTASEIWSGPVQEHVDDRHDYGEARILASGIAEGRILVVVYTLRGANRRIISARRAKARERRRYEEKINRRSGSPSN
jgi:hypothetical protein